MREVIRQLVELQERDQKILAVEAEISSLDPQRAGLRQRAEAARSRLDGIRQEIKTNESHRKELELEIESHRETIARYSIQQYQTKKNDEYRALTHQIETCKRAIFQIEDRQLDLMEKSEQHQRELEVAARADHEVSQAVDQQLADMDEREASLRQALASLQEERARIAAGIGDTLRGQYERLLKHRGARVLVGVERGVCGGCHMILPPQVLISCRTSQELVQCPNCSRILYFTPEMDMSPAGLR